ncbi:Receptor expression-enhancing protein [Plasmodiophora brassicae]|uniref:Receptor expression-enhancing protein n=1 Tax=Plasmodiophora brassicae TaxID=37360 RepID=A0A0G4ILB2_PLABS|nr:hypothetical protein PBRA_004639 [Plasmodiophora brassicae]SPQ93501.1 unnamed protein product [Plasmodiophora brassicae]
MDQVEILKTKVVVWVEELDAALVSRKIQVLGVVKDRTGLKHAHAAILSAGVFFLILLSAIGGKALTNCVGFIYPTIMSFQAVKSKDTEDDAYWLTYWIVFGVFQLVESFGDLILGWIPLYNLLKCIILVWLYAPQTKGAQIVFKQFIAPFMKKHSQEIQETIAAAKTFGAQMEAEVVKPTAKHLANKISETAMDMIASQLRAQQEGAGPTTSNAN